MKAQPSLPDEESMRDAIGDAIKHNLSLEAAQVSEFVAIHQRELMGVHRQFNALPRVQSFAEAMSALEMGDSWKQPWPLPVSLRQPSRSPNEPGVSTPLSNCRLLSDEFLSDWDSTDSLTDCSRIVRRTAVGA